MTGHSRRIEIACNYNRRRRSIVKIIKKREENVQDNERLFSGKLKSFL